MAKTKTTKPPEPKLVLPMPDYAARDAAVYPSDEWQRANMRVLATQILIHKLEYYYGAPGAAVDDQEYDLKWGNLLWLEGRYPHLKDPDSISNTPGAPLLQTYLK